MKKIINLLALVLIAVSVIACSNPSDSVMGYQTYIQPIPQGTNNEGQETLPTNDGNQETPNNGGNQNGEENQGGQEQQNGENQNSQTDTIVKFTKNTKSQYRLECDLVELASDGYYVYVTYNGVKYKVENFKYNSNDVQSMSATSYNKNANGFYFKTNSSNEVNIYLNYISNAFVVNFNTSGYPNAYIGLDTSNGVLVINLGN